MIEFDGSDVISWRPTDSDINMEMTEEDIFDETAKPYDRTLKMTAEVDTAVDTEPEPESEPYQTLIALTPANSRKKTKTPRLVLEDADIESSDTIKFQPLREEGKKKKWRVTKSLNTKDTDFKKFNSI